MRIDRGLASSGLGTRDLEAMVVDCLESIPEQEDNMAVATAAPPQVWLARCKPKRSALTC